MEIRRMLAGANHYYQGCEILRRVGAEAKEQGWETVCVVGGANALKAAWTPVREGLQAHGVGYVLRQFGGFCTAGEIDDLARCAAEYRCDAIIGVGGGKALDLSKAAAALLKRPVLTVPTSAATCAAFAPLSIVYNEQGQQAESRFHSTEVAAVFVDLTVIARAPARLMAAGMADALAKSCEYSSAFPELRYGDIDTAKYCGYRLAQAGDEVLLSCGAQAYDDVLAQRVTPALEDAVFASIANIGVVSGMCGYTNKPGGRFAIAHGFNEIIRGRWEKDPRRWLHGELVAVGILAQMHVNNRPDRDIQQVRQFYRSIHVPASLTDLGMALSPEDFARFQREIADNTSMGRDFVPRIYEAVASVR